MIWQNIIALLAGSGVFIVGMNMMGNGLEQSAGNGMKKLLGKISSNRFSGVAVGATVTAIIQSSAATSVMAIGFVNAGIMTLFQATSIIMGANIGTTVTGILVSLKSLNISLYASLLAFIGVMMTFFKQDKVKLIGSIICGLGVIFIGLDLMSASFSAETTGGKALTTFFENIFSAIDFPLLLVLVGMVFTALIQSSSAATGIVIIMVGSGALNITNALFIVLGSNIGTCVTAVIASLGTSVNAKRTALIHLTFNVIGTILFGIVLILFSGSIVNLLQILVDKPEMQIAWFHVLFNVTTTLILLPFIKHLVKFAEFVIKDNKPVEEELKLKYVDDLLLKTPPIAIMQTKKELAYMIDLARENFKLSQKALFTGDKNITETIARNEKTINFTNKTLTRFLIKLSSLVASSEEKIIGTYFHVLNDVERIGDHAENFYEIGEELKKQGKQFSEQASQDISNMYNVINEMFDTATAVFNETSVDKLSLLTEKENEVDKLEKTANNNHVQRLSLGSCNAETSALFFSTIAGLERVADHLVNVGFSILNPTGSQHA